MCLTFKLVDDMCVEDVHSNAAEKCRDGKPASVYQPGCSTPIFPRPPSSYAENASVCPLVSLEVLPLASSRD